MLRFVQGQQHHLAGRDLDVDPLARHGCCRRSQRRACSALSGLCLAGVTVSIRKASGMAVRWSGCPSSQMLSFEKHFPFPPASELESPQSCW